MGKVIGVLALQGDFARHQAMLDQVGVASLQVKRADALAGCDGLIIPGGESTTLTKLILKYDLYDPLRKFAEQKPVMGTCAGAILLARTVDDDRVTPLKLMNVSVARNAYGRQIDSFITHVDAPFLGGAGGFKAVFIRAPKIVGAGPETDILISLNDDPVMAREKNILALTFHPELTDDPRIHRYFADTIPC